MTTSALTLEVPDRRFGKVRITSELLDLLFTDMLHSEVHVSDMLEYDRANDTWTFLCSGPDFPNLAEFSPVPYVDAVELRRIREFREDFDAD